MAVRDVPTLGFDLFSDAVLQNPYPHYRELRDAGEAVYLDRHGVWALSRYTAVRSALRDYQTFSSNEGVGLSADVNQMMPDMIISNDGELHRQMRTVLTDQLGPRALQQLTDDIEAEADQLVERAVSEGRPLDGMADLAGVLPVSVVGRLIGLPEQDRMKISDWADCAFTVLGPMNERTQDALPQVEAFFEYLGVTAARERLAPDSWGAAIYQAGDRGEIPPESCFYLMFALAGAGMDTTISALGSALWLFANHPDQWERVCADRSLVPAAFNEVLRIETPIQLFSRVLQTDYDAAGVTVPAGSRVLVMYGSGNRDERHYPEPDRFDIDRNPIDHLAFGYGLHACVGQPLAKIEAHAVLDALARRAVKLEASTPTWKLNNLVRCIGTMPMTITA